MQYIKCVVVGDRGVDKAKLLRSFTEGRCPQFEATVFPSCVLQVEVNGALYNLGLGDTTGHEDYPILQRLMCDDTDVFLVCFSVVSPSSFESVREKWVPEVLQHCPKTPFLLVGTQLELRDDGDTLRKLARMKEAPLTTEDGENLAQELRAVKYVECSAVTQEGLNNVFYEAVLAALDFKTNQHNSFCFLL